MGKLQLKGKDLRKLGYPEDKVIGVAIDVMHRFHKHTSDGEAKKILTRILSYPDGYIDDAVLGKIAACLIDQKNKPSQEINLNRDIKEYAIYGAEHIETGALSQMETAMQLPVTMAGALMPDAHQGYGLPIGGVLATENTVIPYGVGVDIGCRMCLSVFELPPDFSGENTSRLKNILQRETLFGAGGEFKNPMDDEILERKEFREIPILRSLHAKAGRQLGTSGSGNHFAEFGTVEVPAFDDHLNMLAGKYLALLSHSGSRGLGANVAGYYTKVAMEKCQLPGLSRHLAWLNMNSEEGQEYWQAMSLCGDYASACHHHIHAKVAKSFGVQPMRVVENHHNFAWKENHEGKEVIVHRKGATPAGKDVLGIIPGSMTDPGFIVKGKGDPASLNSAAHGAGRRMSRSAAKKSLTQSQLNEVLKKHNISLMGGGLDEAPMAYKNIQEVMQSQQNLIDIIGIFHPRIVRMDS
ncbi:MAG: RtcB family protein [Chitinophagales bacterium]